MRVPPSGRDVSGPAASARDSPAACLLCPALRGGATGAGGGLASGPRGTARLRRLTGGGSHMLALRIPSHSQLGKWGLLGPPLGDELLDAVAEPFADPSVVVITAVEFVGFDRNTVASVSGAGRRTMTRNIRLRRCQRLRVRVCAVLKHRFRSKARPV